MTVADRILQAQLELKAQQCRNHVLRMIRAGGHGHIGGAFSSIDVVTALYFHVMHVDPQNPKWEDRDRFLLSAGHKCLAQYAVLADKGFFPMEVLDTYGSLKSPIPGHPDMKKLPGIEGNTGALGHGLSIATGMALGLRQDGKQSRVFVVLGDGELAEGSNWEAAAAAAHYGVDNLVAIVDNNDLQISGRVKNVMNLTPIDQHFRGFGWEVVNIDGNDMGQILDAFQAMPLKPGKPSMIVAHTVKCKGLSFGEDQVGFHFWTPKGDELERAEAELAEKTRELERKLEEVQG